MCPSRGRPSQCDTLITSFLKTARHSTLKICLDHCDPTLEQYRTMIAGRVPYVIDFRKTTTKIINEHWEFSADCFRWFSVTNDDFVYHTDAWDEKLIGSLKLHGGQGVVFGNDLLQGARLPTCSIVSREIVKALGWLQMPGLTHLFGDNVWQHLGANAGCLLYRSDVIIEHRHWCGKKAEMDDTYKETNGSAMYDKDQLAFIKWLHTSAPDDILKVKAVTDPVFRKA